MHAELRHRGARVSRKRVARLMREAGLSGLIRRRRARTTICVPGVRPSPDLVGRDFQAAGPNALWAADLTEITTWEGKLYLAVVVDCFSRRCVGWAMADNMRAELVVEALEMAIWQRKPDPGLIHHSDQGSLPELNRSSQQCVGEMNLGTRGDGCCWGSPRGLGSGGAAVVAEARPEGGPERR